jgi:SAM-dependent methyltransferase
MTAQSENPAPPVLLSAVGLSQRSRAGLDILGGMLKYAAVDLRDAARQAFEAAPEGMQLAEAHAQPSSPAETADRVQRAKALAQSNPTYRLERFVQRFVAEEMMTRNVVAAEEKRADHLRIDSVPRQGAGGRLELDPDLEMPDYYDGVNYHLSIPDIEDYDLGGKGGGIGLVFRYGGFAAVPPGANIAEHRLQVIGQFPKARYDRILEIGCGGVFTLMTVHKVFPEAELVGCDLAARYLTQAHDMAERMGLKVDLKQRDARRTGEPDASFDGVLSYAVHHEAPVPVNIEMFQEVFRVLKPGGDFVISDPPPFRAVDPFHAAILEWDNDHREEPYFTETCLADWDEELRRIGFVDVQSHGLGPGAYPYVTRATKPLV